MVGADVLLQKRHGGAGVVRRPVCMRRRCECLLSVTLRTLKGRMTVARIVLVRKVNKGMRGRQSMMISTHLSRSPLLKYRGRYSMKTRIANTLCMPLRFGVCTSFLLTSALLLVSCRNTPPIYRPRARAVLERQGISSETIDNLINFRGLQDKEIQILLSNGDPAVLHLLGRNPSIPIDLIERLSKHPQPEVRYGVAANPKTRFDLLMRLRMLNQYATINEYIARNPSVPEELLKTMLDHGEVSLGALASNPNLTPELIDIVIRDGNEIDRAIVARNPNLSLQNIRELEDQDSALVRQHLLVNPVYREYRRTFGSK